MEKSSQSSSHGIKVIWVDDNPDIIAKQIFRKFGIYPAIFKTADEALAEYQIHRGTYQAVILDIQGDDGTVNEFSKAVKEFDTILKKDLVPLYVLTRYSQNDYPYLLANGIISSFRIKQENFFNILQQLKLIEKIKKDVVTESEWFRAYKKYEAAFEAFENGTFDKEYQEALYKIVQCIDKTNEDYIELFNQMRKIFEMIFFKFIEYKMPPRYIYNKTDLPSASPDNIPRECKKVIIDFLKGQPIKVCIKGTKIDETIMINKKPVLSALMADIVYRLLDILNKNSHYNPEMNLSNKDLKEKLPHFFESTALLLIDLIIWAKNEISDKKHYTVKRITPDNERTKISEAEKGLITKKTFLEPGESRIEVKVTQNIKNRERPQIRSVDNPDIFIGYNQRRCRNLQDFLGWFDNNPNKTVNVIVRNAFEIVRFEY